MNIQASISRVILLLSFSIILLFSCKPGNPSSLAEVLEAVSPKAQQSSIDPATDNIIEGEKGTKVFIPANSLQFKDGTYPKEKVTVELKEFYSITDMLSNRLSTVSGSDLLETGGMVHLAAFSEGKELQIDKEKSLAIAFPDKNGSKEKGMHIFYGDTSSVPGQVNWVSDRRGSDASGDEKFTDSDLYKNQISVCSYEQWEGDDSLLSKLNDPDSNLFSYISNNFKITDSILARELCQNGQQVYVNIFIGKSGKVSKVVFSKWFLGDENYAIPQTLKKSVTDFFLSLPSFKMESTVKGSETPFHLTLCCHFALDQKKFEEQFNKKYSQYRDVAVQKIDPKELNYYILSASKLGWINCDRFLNNDIEKTDFIVKQNMAADANVMIAFDSINSVIQGIKNNDAFVFENVPLGSKVRVIAIAYKDGKPLLSKMAATISKRDFVISGFTEFSLKDLDNELNKK